MKHEFAAGTGSFLLQLRSGRGWDKASFARLFVAMRDCCKAYEGKSQIERWIAEGFWYLPWYVKQEVQQRGLNVSEYHNNAVVNLDHLAFWLFMEEKRCDDEFEPMDDDRSQN